MKAVNDRVITMARRLLLPAISGALLALLAGCAAGPSNVLINVQPYATPPAAREALPASRGTVRVEPVKDARHDAVGALVGQRTGLGGVSMGSIEINPLPTAMVTSVLQAELAGLGFAVDSSSEQSRVSGRLTKFEITTPATAVYWDVNGVVELELALTGPGGAPLQSRYSATCTDRTYTWPGEGIIAGVVSSCLKELGGKIRGDAALAGMLGSRP